MAEQGLFEPDVIMPAQLRPATPLTGEHRLCLAVVEGVLLDLQHFSPRQQLHHDALAWIDNDDESHAFSLGAICALFGWDPERLRCALRDVSEAWYRGTEKRRSQA